ncbi:alpha/beta hydrolase [Sphingomonas sp. KRR8]|uniref:alpha/beta hydrolase n=1 Tax=Sphingomonas sp. KRR8 TaxID=2942996 RepID=UPI00202291D4|nr:alpha/beta hydrolase [Sphingomonas sp. KRR8]URD59731.1 alpha/beta hydrolase [Sphingomonas sp. KRR8]
MIRPLLAAALGLASLTACSPTGLLSGLDRVTAPGAPGRVASGISFGEDPRLKLDVYSPEGRRRPGARLPVVVFFYGGGWVGGARGDYAFAGRAFASKGFVAIIPDYRLVPTVRFPTFIEDGALAVRWARDHAAEFGGDPRRLTLSGHSAGAYNAAMLALDPHFLRDAGVDPRTVRAAALLAGPYDFYPFTEQRGRDALGAWPRPLDTQPIHFARADAPPLLLAAGTADTVVKPGNSERLAQKLRSLGAPVELRLYPGRSHVDLVKGLSVPFRGSSPVLADSIDFLRANSR